MMAVDDTVWPDFLIIRRRPSFNRGSKFSVIFSSCTNFNKQLAYYFNYTTLEQVVYSALINESTTTHCSDTTSTSNNAVLTDHIQIDWEKKQVMILYIHIYIYRYTYKHVRLYLFACYFASVKECYSGELRCQLPQRLYISIWLHLEQQKCKHR